MLVKRLLAILFFVSACQLQAQTVIVDDNLEFEVDASGLGNHQGTVCQDSVAGTSSCDSTLAFFDWDGTNIDAVNFSLDEGSDYYVVQPGDHFDLNYTKSAPLPLLVIADELLFPSVTYPAVQVGAGIVGQPVDFYLGVATGLSDPCCSERDVFGWVHLRDATGTGQLTMVGNAVAYGYEGIIAGTTIGLPEPSSALLVLTGLALRLTYRGRGSVLFTPE